MNLREFYFTNYRLLLDEAICNEPHKGHLADFEKPIPYTDTFTVRLGNGAELDARYEEAVKYPVVFETQHYAIHKLKDGWAFVRHEEGHFSKKLLEASSDCSQMSIYMADERNYFLETSDIDPTKTILFATGVPLILMAAMALKDTLALHASLVECDGYGVIFLGVSGAGKSTQAKLWKKYLNADFIIGDRAVCRKCGNVWYGYGMPWDGSDKLQRQRFAPIKALIALEQAKENRIRRMSAVEAVQVLLRQTRLPVWHKEAMQKNTELIGHLAQEIPFYHLQNRADEEGVNLTYNTLKEIKN